MYKFYHLIFFLTFLICISCNDEDPTTQSANYITACNEAEFEIQFFGTNFWDSELGQWYNLDNNGNKLINPITGTSKFCRKYIDDSTVDPNDPFLVDTEPTNDSKVEVEINSNGTMDVTLKLTDMNVLSGLGGGTSFYVEIYLEDIASYNIGQQYTISTGMGMNVHAGSDFWNATYTITFSTIDVTNHIYEGSASAYLENYMDVNLFPNYYEPGTSLNFTCDINYFKFDKI
ncbi:MAG: hypothetical protein VX370_03575 [Bacteroidota bacterium]|nr:hypothetical protein [Bacteroidota bacterium]